MRDKGGGMKGEKGKEREERCGVWVRDEGHGARDEGGKVSEDERS